MDDILKTRAINIECWDSVVVCPPPCWNFWLRSWSHSTFSL